MKSKSLWTECGTCKKQISMSAKSCPHCGARLKRSGVLKWAGGAFLVLVVIGGIARTNEDSESASSVKGIPEALSETGTVVAAVASEKAQSESQRAFLAVVAQYKERFRSASNELQQSALRDERRNALIKAVGSGLTAEGWIGTLRKLQTNTEGKATITVQLSPDADLMTWNNALSDAMHETMIDKGTPLYAALMNMAVGDVVTVSGGFIQSDQDGAWETSMTIEGSMTAPEFLFRFKTISRQ